MGRTLSIRHDEGRSNTNGRQKNIAENSAWMPEKKQSFEVFDPRGNKKSFRRIALTGVAPGLSIAVPTVPYAVRNGSPSWASACRRFGLRPFRRTRHFCNVANLGRRRCRDIVAGRHRFGGLFSQRPTLHDNLAAMMERLIGGIIRGNHTLVPHDSSPGQGAAYRGPGRSDNSSLPPVRRPALESTYPRAGETGKKSIRRFRSCQLSRRESRCRPGPAPLFITITPAAPAPTTVTITTITVTVVGVVLFPPLIIILKFPTGRFLIPLGILQFHVYFAQ